MTTLFAMLDNAGSISKSACADSLLAVYESDHKTALRNFARYVLAQLRDCNHNWVAVQYAQSTADYREIDLFQGQWEKSWLLESFANVCPACLTWKEAKTIQLPLLLTAVCNTQDSYIVHLFNSKYSLRKCLSIMVEGNLISLPTMAEHTKVVFQLQHAVTDSKLQLD
ncbi:hypothetical protein BDD12DRAFT_806399 [Trichophaea hybrida]|nr:hypothetical protein BDD12DRAFT_806399 [Trichophaea hybrida]